MATRENLFISNAFFIEFTDFFNNGFSFMENGFHSFFKFQRVTVSPIFQDSFVKLYKKFTHLFLSSSKKGVYFFNNIKKRCRLHAPYCNGSFSGLFFGKTDISSKSIHKPREDWISGISDFQRSVIHFVGSVFWLPGFNPESSLRLNKTSKICKVRIARIDRGFSLFNFIDVFFGNKVDHFVSPIIVNYLNTSFVGLFANWLKVRLVNRLYKEKCVITLFSFINKIVTYIFTKTFTGFQNPTVRSFMSFLLVFFENVSSVRQKAFEVFYFYGKNLKATFKNCNITYFLNGSSKIKTTISIYISSQIGKFCSHDRHVTDKLNKYQDSQRLSDQDAEKQVYATVRPNKKLLERGITRLSAILVLILMMVIKVTECRQTEDELTRDVLVATASVVNATGGANGDNPTNLARSDIDEVIRTLASNDAWTIAMSIEGEDKFGTAPVRDAYFAMGSTRLIGDLESVAGFIAKAQYPSPMDALREEWGSISNLRFLLSSIGSVTPNASALGRDVYNVPVCGLEAYAVIDQENYGKQFRYRPPMVASVLGLNAEIGWVMPFVSRITNDAWIINLRTTLST